MLAMLCLTCKILKECIELLCGIVQLFGVLYIPEVDTCTIFMLCQAG